MKYRLIVLGLVMIVPFAAIAAGTMGVTTGESPDENLPMKEAKSKVITSEDPQMFGVKALISGPATHSPEPVVQKREIIYILKGGVGGDMAAVIQSQMTYMEGPILEPYRRDRKVIPKRGRTGAGQLIRGGTPGFSADPFLDSVMEAFVDPPEEEEDGEELIDDEARAADLHAIEVDFPREVH